MRAIKKRLQSLLLIGVSVVLVSGAPLAAYAEDVPSTDAPSSTQTPPPTDTTTVTPAPSSTDAQSTNSSSTPSTTTQVAPKPTYVYDASSGHWNSDQWQYDAMSDTYKPQVQAAAPAPVATPTPDSTTSTSTASSLTNSTIANALNSVATSGGASVLNNTAAGNATTGNASSAATIMNNVNSSMTNADNKQAASFVSNVMGDVNGDIILQPMLLKAMLEANAATSSSTTNTGLTNDVSLNATTGNATVSGNTVAGSATTGNANTVANVVNVINSMVAANQSFMGTINIYGNLNGDILIAPDFIPQLLAANGGSAPVGSATVADNSTQSVVNNIALAAKTGSAVVSGNTSAGDATTGDASTNVVIFNLTNHAIVASNSLLVFVNVLGHWVGVIVDAPVGATAAAIGNDVTSDTVSPSLTVNATNNALLTNNINLSSQSGDATVSHNTTAGNAMTGNATASANIANITGSQLGLSGWFGVLFINVFGSWTGSFGVDTSAGNPIVQPPTQPQGSRQPSAPLQVISFVPRNLHQTSTVIQGGFTSQTGGSDSSASTSPAGEVLSAMTNNQQKPSVSPVVSSSSILQSIISILMLLGTMLLFGGIVNRFRRVLV